MTNTLQELPCFLEFHPDDIVILVMGMTGYGKSTFISRCTGVDVGISHGRNSFTRNVSCSTIKYKGRTIRLIDTPGFDDKDFDDAEILREISTRLSLSPAGGRPFLLSGIIYLHTISNPKMRGTDQNILAMFQAFCGEENLSTVVIATTMWAGVDPVVGKDRQEDLSKNHWSSMIEAGTVVRRHDDTKASALAILEHVIEQNKHVTLRIQEELSSGMNMKLEDTGAGRVLRGIIVQERQKGEAELEKITAELLKEEHTRDEEETMECIAEEAEYVRAIKSKDSALEKMQVDMKTMIKMHAETYQKAQEDRDKQRKTDAETILSLELGCSRLTEELQRQSAEIDKPAQHEIEGFEFQVANVTKGQQLVTTQLLPERSEKQLLKELERQRNSPPEKSEKKVSKTMAVGLGAGLTSAVTGVGSFIIGILS